MEKLQKLKDQEQQSNITVAIRIRPLSLKQINSDDFDIVRVQDNLIVVLDPLDIELEDKKVTDVLHRSKEQRYAFDKIYRNQTSETIYMETTAQLVKTVLKGFNSTVFAYGPTGTGKTYTMLGNQDVYGLNVLAIKDIFKQIQHDHQNKYTVYITYVEIYNEMIRDLLVPTSGYLELRDDPEKGIVIAGITEFKAESTEQVMNLLLSGNRRRTTQATNANLTSSRSHAVFQINISKTSRVKNTTVQSLLGKLSLIDLAGSERGTVTQNRGIRLMEGAKINRSLLALANCINALGDKNKKGFFVPYRDSKLTRLLKDSLGGNCKTVMIVNVSPSGAQFEETINTLKYANRAKNIKTKAITNKKLVSLHISQYKNIINDLHRQIEELKIRLSDKVYEPKDYNMDDDGTSRQPEILSPKIEGSCSLCGRIDEKQAIKGIKEQIFENFNERIQLRRAMMEIQQQNAMNILEIRKKQGEILLLKKQQDWEDNTESQNKLKGLNKAISTLKLSTNKNTLKKQITNLQIMQSITATRKIRDEIIKNVKSKENRDSLEIIIKNHVLQLQNIQLQINLQIQQRMISDMKQIIFSQKTIIKQNNIEIVNIQDDLEMQDQLEIQLEDQDDVHDNLDLDQDPFDDDEDEIQVESYKNFEFPNKNKGYRNNSAKKEMASMDNRKKKQNNMAFLKKKDKDQPSNQISRQKSLDKAKMEDFALKGMKMNMGKKR